MSSTECVYVCMCCPRSRGPTAAAVTHTEQMGSRDAKTVLTGKPGQRSQRQQRIQQLRSVTRSKVYFWTGWVQTAWSTIKTDYWVEHMCPKQISYLGHLILSYLKHSASLWNTRQWKCGSHLPRGVFSVKEMLQIHSLKQVTQPRLLLCCIVSQWLMTSWKIHSQILIHSMHKPWVCAMHCGISSTLLH